jgi:putative membrane protein
MAVAPNFGFRDGVVALLAGFLIASGISPNDRVVWVLETFWVMIAIGMWALWLRRKPATATVFTIVVIHSVVLIVGGIYTYTKVPIGAWVQELMGRPRNDYDRLGHFLQGFAPALVWREVFIRGGVVSVRGWLGVIVVGMCLAFSALFELLEFAGAILVGEPGVNFLGAQGDAWDAQWDMLFCLVGSVVALFTLGYTQDHELRTTSPRANSAEPDQPPQSLTRP